MPRATPLVTLCFGLMALNGRPAMALKTGWLSSFFGGSGGAPALEVADVAPGQGNMEDEATVVQQRIEVPKVAPKHVASLVMTNNKEHSDPALPKNFAARSHIAQRTAPIRAPVIQKPVEEYDVVALPEEQRAQRASEPLSMEDLRRIKEGAIEHSEPPRLSAEPIALSASSAQESPKERMQAQCNAFAAWAKDKGVKGAELSKLWKSTCAPMLATADATFKMMCSQLESKMAFLSNQPDWHPKRACAILVDHFFKSNVGADPLE